MYIDGLKLQLRGIVIGAIIGLVFGIIGVSSGEHFFTCIFLTYEFVEIGLGLRIVNKITDMLFGNLTIIGTLWFWFIACIIKMCIAGCIGAFALLIFIIKTIIDYKKTMAQANEIIEKEKSSKNSVKNII